ncbi:RagB/SusD family nutrient uptake outer membrane protein [Flavobacterium sp. I3-2]|uniref:RagB/SusD family nutrient uptake outer membrane protein n=1 Tax=Flavobacterium sp. I3-2 TaxID=2748319 RepID=UPI0015ACBAC8|nr:RagB/SusD family nutrient uptake outer membrane protein [Flavobacterium sp. I3-2]
MKKKYIQIVLSITLIGSVYACEDFLEVEIPKDQLDNNKVFQNEMTATAAVVNVYSLLRNNGFLSGNKEGIGYLMGCYTDELKAVNNQDVNYRLFYNGTVLSTNSAVKSLWNNTYQQIYAVNNILEGIENSNSLSPEFKNQLNGEALAIRGMLHFYLAMTLGDVPYVNTTNYELNKKISKLKSEVVLENAVQDLLASESVISENYVSIERVRLNKSAVQALLARVYLYQKKWALAQEYAQEVINNTTYGLESLDKTFLKESKSAIWQLLPDNQGKNTLEGSSYIFTAMPAKDVVITQELYDSFESNDLRKIHWFKSVGDSNVDNIHAFKYKERGATGTTSKEYSIVLRIEEMYLIHAEAAAMLNDWTSCNQMLNAIRNRAGLTNSELSDINTAQTLIITERRKELFCEFGHRFYDLKRLQRWNELIISKPFWSSHFEKLPLPETELQLNPNLLPQNNGY